MRRAQPDERGNEHDTVIFFLPLAGSPLVNTAVQPCSFSDQRGAIRLIGDPARHHALRRRRSCHPEQESEGKQ